MGNPALTPYDHFTYGQYLTWPDSERWELIEGQAWMMNAPLRTHQKLQHRLALKFGNFLEGKPCEAYEAPFDVLLPRGDESDRDVDTVVQPDLVVYCDKSKLTRAGARGAPDVAVEILSPSTSRKDQSVKFELYAKHGVREYWVVDPEGEWICVYRPMASASRQDGGGLPGFDEGELREPCRDYSPIASKVLEGFSIDPAELFKDLD